MIENLGGKSCSRIDMTINAIFIGVVAGLFVIEVATRRLPADERGPADRGKAVRRGRGNRKHEGNERGRRRTAGATLSRRYPEPTVGGVVYNDRGEVLLLKSRKSRDRYVIPGGHIELGEDMETALRREIREETGLEVHDIRLAAVQQFVFDEAFHEKRHFIFIDYTCRAGSTEVTLNEEHQGYLWARPETAAGLDVEPFTAGLLAELSRGEDSPYARRILYNYKRS